MSKMQQQTPQTMNSAASTPLNLVSTEQIQKCLDENKNLIMAILESQKMGKVAECAQYQAILQKNLMYLAAVADAQPQGSTTTPSQVPTSSFPQQTDSRSMQTQGPTVQQQQQQQQQQQPKMPFQLNSLRSQDQQQNQMLQFQQHHQLQGHFGLSPNNGLHLLMQQPGHANLMDFRGNQSDDRQGNSSLGPMDGRD